MITGRDFRRAMSSGRIRTIENIVDIGELPESQPIDTEDKIATPEPYEDEFDFEDEFYSRPKSTNDDYEPELMALTAGDEKTDSRVFTISVWKIPPSGEATRPRAISELSGYEPDTESLYCKRFDAPELVTDKDKTLCEYGHESNVDEGNVTREERYDDIRADSSYHESFAADARQDSGRSDSYHDYSHEQPGPSHHDYEDKRETGPEDDHRENSYIRDVVSRMSSSSKVLQALESNRKLTAVSSNLVSIMLQKVFCDIERHCSEYLAGKTNTIQQFRTGVDPDIL